MFKRVTFPHILALAVVVILVGTLPSLAQHGGFRGGSVSRFHGGGGAFHGGGSFGGFHHGSSFNTFHGGRVNHFHHGGFGGYYYGSHHYHGGYYVYPYHGGYYGDPYYSGGYYGYPWYGGFSIGFGFGPFWGFWGYPYGYRSYPSPYSSYPYGPYRRPSHSADDRNGSSEPPAQNRESGDPPADKPSRCDYRYEDTCNANNKQAPAAPSNVRPPGPPDVNYVTTKVAH